MAGHVRIFVPVAIVRVNPPHLPPIPLPNLPLQSHLLHDFDHEKRLMLRQLSEFR